MQLLELKPVGEVELTHEWVNKVYRSENKTKQVHGISTRVLLGWKVTFTGTKEDRQYLEDFFDSVQGQRHTFLWNDRNGTQHIVSFNVDKLPFIDKYDQAFSCTVILEKEYNER